MAIKGKKNTFQMILILSIIMGLSSLVSIAGASNVSELIYSHDSRPYGLSYGDWSVKWRQWAFSIPTDKSPIFDKSGIYCDTNQDNPNVWFLTGSGGGKAERACTIPADKSIFFPIINVECSYAETPTFSTETELRDCARADQDTVSSLRLTIDGLEIENVTKFRTDSPLFNFTTPESGLFGWNSTTSQGVSDGYCVMLKPLPPGAHESRFSAFLGVVTIISGIFIGGILDKSRP